MKRHHKAWILALVICVLLPVQVVAKTIDEVRAQQEELQRENETLEAQLESLRKDESKALEYQEKLEKKIRLTEQKIDASRESVRAIDREIGELEQRLADAKQAHADTLSLFAQRLRALYTSGTAGTLEILLSSNSIADFSMKMEFVSAVSKHDQALVDKIEEYLQETQTDREKLTGLREEEVKVKRDLEKDQEELEKLLEENQALLDELEEKQEKTRDAIARNEEEDAELEEELQRLIEERNQQVVPGVGVDPVTPGMSDSFSPIWPLPGIGIGNITGHFGDMYDNGPHNGLDIGAPYGTPIVAAQAGQVISAEYHWSWGNNVLIWHNTEFATRYAHCSALAVEPGQYVEQGQIIGYVGSTGYSFGNHLHFEVYYNGVRVNPDPYLGIY